MKSGDKKAESSNLGIAAQGINGAVYLLAEPLWEDDVFKLIIGYLGYENLADAYLRFCEKRQNIKKSLDSQQINKPRKLETKEAQAPEVETKEV